MTLPATALERAFQLAKCGSCTSIDDIKKQLKAEGYSTAQVTGGALLKQLRALIRNSPKMKPPTRVNEQDG